MARSGEGGTPPVAPQPGCGAQLVTEAETQTTPQYSFIDAAQEEPATPPYSFSDIEEQQEQQQGQQGLPPDYERHKKRLRHSLPVCCCCVDLRVGCCFMGIFEMCTSALCLLFGESNLLLYLGRLGYLAYLIGSAMLLVGTVLEWQCLVRIYLFANALHLLLCPIFVVQHALRSCYYCYFEIILLSLLLVLGLYFELVAYSYLVHMQWQHSRFYTPFGRMARGGVRRSRWEDVEQEAPALESQEQSEQQSRSQSRNQSHSHVDLLEEPSNEQQSVL
ncbi:uncharacterized protein LOC111064916 [Drosophila obscura]|uniref:uncharacterized protein LOC111064916 n=1 Tax=Drosophila obscura TaxID=7282 RepID=UPI001BB21BE5|nr:uncharacterized protein LOC111064916 [Drosophila obscura]